MTSKRSLAIRLIIGCATAALAVGMFATSAWGFSAKVHGEVTRTLQCGNGLPAGSCFQGRAITALAGNSPRLGLINCPRARGIVCQGAVQAPDFITGKGNFAEGINHCDNADHDIIGDPNYPQSFHDAVHNLHGCIDQFHVRMQNAIVAARALVKDGKITDANLPTLGCKFPGAPLDAKDKNARCTVLNQLGRAMHAAQDFYAHSNWTDVGGGMSLTDPPGLAKPPADLAIWFNVPIPRSFSIPPGLVTGCDDSPGGKLLGVKCAGRITHSTLNKDDPGARRGKINGNYHRAFLAAQYQTRAIWMQFIAALSKQYGQHDANLMVQALTRD